MTRPSTPPSRKRRVVRMKDIAERSQVSLTTVSRLLRGEHLDRFPQETRDRVLNAAHELGWSPNRLVQGIQTGRTGTVGLVMAPFGEHWQGIMVALHRTLVQADSVPIALYPDYGVRDPHGAGTEVDHLKHLMERRVDGLICWPLNDQVAIDYLCDVCATQVPVVAIDFELPKPHRAIVIHTLEREAMTQAVDHLTRLGHRKIGYYGMKDSHVWAADRRQAFLDTMRERGLTPAFAEDLAKHVASAPEVIRSNLSKATAVVAASAQLAISLWHVAREADLLVPRDLSIISFGNMYFEFTAGPDFTYIDQQPGKIGQAAASVIIESQGRQNTLPSSIDIESVLVIAKTTAPPPA